MDHGQSRHRHPPDAYVKPNGMRDLTMEEYVRRDGDQVRVWERDGTPIVTLELSPEGLDFLIDSLPRNDLYTEQLRYARKLSKEALWDREAR